MELILRPGHAQWRATIRWQESALNARSAAWPLRVWFFQFFFLEAVTSWGERGPGIEKLGFKRRLRAEEARGAVLQPQGGSGPLSYRWQTGPTGRRAVRGGKQTGAALGRLAVGQKLVRASSLLLLD